MSKNSGKSKTYENQNGIRRKALNGAPLAPRSLRPKIVLLAQCTEAELEKAKVEKDDS